MFTFFPELARCAWANDEERLALLAHRYFGNGATLKTRGDFEEVLSKAGIRLCYESGINSFGSLAICEEKGMQSPVFFIRNDLDWIEQKFLIANFLGRVLFDAPKRTSSGFIKFTTVKETFSPYQRYLLSKRPRAPHSYLQASKNEWLADEFAGAFLLPKQWLKKFVEHERDPLLIAAHYSLSLDFLHARIKHIRQKSENMFSPNTSLRFKQHSKHKLGETEHWRG